MANRFTPKAELERLNKQEEKILALLREERNRAKKKFPLAYALIATFGGVCIFVGFSGLIRQIEFLNSYPITLVIFGVILLIITGEAYKRLGK